MQKKDFKVEELQGFRLQREEARLEEAFLTHEALRANGWMEPKVTLKASMERVRHASEEDAKEIEVEGVFLRSLTSAITSTCESPNAKHMEFIPYQLCRKNPYDGTITRYYSEIHNSNDMLEQDAQMRAQPRNAEDGAEVEYCIFSIIFYSDSMRMANFGNASMWPAYMFSRNVSKYVRSKNGNFPAEHIACIPNVSLCLFC